MATTAAPNRTFTERIHRIEPSATLMMMQAAATLRAQGVHLVDLGAGEPHFTTPAHVKEAGIRAITNNETKYMPVAGIPELRRAIAERHAADWGSDFGPEETIFTPGGKFALFLALQTLVEEGDEVIVPVPYWVSFKDMVAYTGATPVLVETREEDGFRLTARSLESAITPRTRAMIINSPNNPTGAVLPATDYEEIVMLAHERGIYVIADECYVYLNYADERDRISAGKFRRAKEHVVVVGSLSKTYAMTGWRCGFALADHTVVQQMAKLQSQSASSISAIGQKAAIAALTGAQDCIATMRAAYVKLRDRCISGLRAIPGITCTSPEGAFYAYPNVSSVMGRNGIQNTLDLCDRLLREAHVVTNAGDTFGTSHHIRLSYAVAPDVLEEALRRLGSWFSEHK